MTLNQLCKSILDGRQAAWTTQKQAEYIFNLYKQETGDNVRHKKINTFGAMYCLTWVSKTKNYYIERIESQQEQENNIDKKQEIISQCHKLIAEGRQEEAEKLINEFKESCK